MSIKIQGYFLFYIGLLIIALSAFSLYRVFTGQSPPVQLFNLPGLNLDPSLLSSLEYENKLPSGVIEILSSSVSNQFANIFAHLTLMSFFGSVGYKVSLIGSQLLRPINVQVKETIREVSAY